MNKNELIKKLESHEPDILGMPTAREHAVILPILGNGEDLHILFEVRALTMRRQPGEVCFPGGKIEKGETPQQAALREMHEELGIHPSEVTSVQKLGMVTTPFGVKLHVFTGFLPQPLDLTLNPDEVQETFAVPFSFFETNEAEVHYLRMSMEPEESFPIADIPNGHNYKWQTLRYRENFYYYKNYVVWGLTALILTDFIERFQIKRHSSN